MLQLAATVGPALIALGLLWLSRGFWRDVMASLRDGRTPEAVEYSRRWRAGHDHRELRPSVSRKSQPAQYWIFVLYTALIAGFLVFLALCALMIMTATLFNGTAWMNS